MCLAFCNVPGANVGVAATKCAHTIRAWKAGLGNRQITAEFFVSGLFSLFASAAAQTHEITPSL